MSSPPPPPPPPSSPPPPPPPNPIDDGHGHGHGHGHGVITALSETSAPQEHPRRRSSSTGNMGMQGAPLEVGASHEHWRSWSTGNMGMRGAPPEVELTHIQIGASEIQEAIQEEEQQTHGEEQNAITPQAAVPRYVSLAFVLIALLIGALVGYDTTVYGGATSSIGFLNQIFPLLKIKENQFQESNICAFYASATQWLNISLHIGAVVSTWIVETTLWRRKSIRALRLLLAGACFHAVGSLTSALAYDAIVIYIGRLCIGVGIGILMQSLLIVLDMMKSQQNRDTDTANCAQILGLLVGPVLANGANLRGLQSPDTYWRLSLGLSGVVSSTIVVLSSVLLWATRRAVIAPDMWLYRGVRFSERRTESYPLLFIEAVRTFFTPLLDLNLYNHVIMMIFTSSDKLTFIVPASVTTWQSICLSSSMLLIRSVGVKIQWISALVMVVVQVATTVPLVAHHDVHSQVGAAFGVPALVLQTIFIVGYSMVSSPSGWIQFPLDNSMKACARHMFWLSMVAQGLVAFWTPFIVCRIGVAVFAIWAGLALFLAAFLFWLVPNTRNAPNEEMQIEQFQNHDIWGYRH